MTSAVEDARRAVEAASGKPVVLLPDPSLKLIARAVLARGDAPAHVVTFNPAQGEATDYHLVYQCGMMLRVFETPPADRFEVVSTDGGRQEAGELVAAHLKRGGLNLPEAARNQFRDQMYNGLVLQLRSMSVGLRVDGWVKAAYPTLADQQRKSAARQLSEYQAALSPQIKALAPEKVYRANLGMNAAFALYWSRELADPAPGVPYRLAGHSQTGEELLSLADSIPSDPPADRELIRAWGERLGIAGWYRFNPFGG